MESIRSYIEKMKNIQINLLEYLDKKDSDESDFENLMQYLDDQKVRKNKNDLYILFSTISEITMNHHFTYNYFSKIERILQTYLDDIKNYFSNYEVYNIFKNNKRVLLYLYNSKIVIPERSFVKYEENMYFFPEYVPFLDSYTLKELQSKYPSDYQQIRKEGKDNQHICQLIQTDSIDDFISYINKESISLSNTKIKPSIYETNPFLYDKELTIIQYAAFFGSIKIFNYLLLKNVEIESSLWPYVIHGNNSEMFSILEEKKIEPINDIYDECYLESVNCYHIDFMNYIKNNYDSKIKNNDLFSLDLNSYNFIDFSDKVENVLNLFENKKSNEKMLNLLAKFIDNDCFDILNLLLKDIEIDLNESVCTFEVGTDYLGNIHDDNSMKQTQKTLLHKAVEKGNLEIVKLLLSNKNVDVNAEDYFDYKSLYYSETVEQKPLHIAVEKGNLQMVQILLSRDDIDVNAIQIMRVTSTNYEKNALGKAVAMGFYDIVKLLLTNKNIDVNWKSIGYYRKRVPGSFSDYKKVLYSEDAPLHEAVKYGFVEITKLLLSQENIIKDIKDLKGMTPLSLAENDEIKKLFTQ